MQIKQSWIDRFGSYNYRNRSKSQNPHYYFSQTSVFFLFPPDFGKWNETHKKHREKSSSWTNGSVAFLGTQRKSACMKDSAKIISVSVIKFIIGGSVIFLVGYSYVGGWRRRKCGRVPPHPQHNWRLVLCSRLGHLYSVCFSFGFGNWELRFFLKLVFPFN